MGTHFSILGWKSPWPQEPGGLQSMGCKQFDMTERLLLLLSLLFYAYRVVGACQSVLARLP